MIIANFVLRYSDVRKMGLGGGLAVTSILGKNLFVLVSRSWVNSPSSRIQKPMSVPLLFRVWIGSLELFLPTGVNCVILRIFHLI